MYVTLIYHGFKLETVLEESISMIKSITIALTDVFNEEFPVESITTFLWQGLLRNHCFY